MQTPAMPGRDRMMTMNAKKMAAMTIGLAAMLLFGVAPATAEVVLVSFTVTADGQTATREFLVSTCDGEPVDQTLVTPDEPMDLLVGGTRLARITALQVATDSDPYVNLRFAVEAGSVDTTFDVVSALVSFDALINPQAYATAGITLTSDSDGALITGLLDEKTYQARYNGTTVYASLAQGFLIGGDVTLTGSERSPATGYDTIFGAVSSIQSEFNFTLSAMDQASGTSRFEVIAGVPEPATMSLLAIGALATLIRRRRNA